MTIGELRKANRLKGAEGGKVSVELQWTAEKKTCKKKNKQKRCSVHTRKENTFTDGEIM